MNLRNGSIFSGKNGIIFLVLLAVIGGLAYVLTSDLRSGINKRGYQLVSLSTGERFIGKLSGLSGEYVTLNDVYYQQNAAADGQQQEQTDITVAKLSASVAKPEDTMRIASDK